MFRIQKTEGYRLFFFNYRVHHGLTGCVFIAIGLALILHDRKDFPWSPFSEL